MLEYQVNSIHVDYLFKVVTFCNERMTLS